MEDLSNRYKQGKYELSGTRPQPVKAVPKINKKKKSKDKTDELLKSLFTEGLVDEKKSKKSKKSPTSDVGQKTEINININVPKLPELPEFKETVKKIGIKARAYIQKTGRRIKIKRPPRRVVNVVMATIIVLAGIGLAVTVKNNNHGSTAVQGTSVAKKPAFTVLFPNSQAKEKMSYDTEKKVASYTGKVKGVDVTVSQQPVPANFKADPNGEVAKLAQSINATTKLDAPGLQAFLGQSIKGPQTVVFTKDGTLVFIKSSEQIPVADWNNFLESLK